MSIFLLAAALAAFAAPALAGDAYLAPKLTPAETLEPPADLRADAVALLKAVQAGDLDAVGSFIAPKVTVVSAALDLGLPRHAEVMASGANPRAATGIVRPAPTSASFSPTWNSTSSRAR